MSALRDYDVSLLTHKTTSDQTKQFINLIVWDLFSVVKDDSIRINIWKIPISIKVSSLEGLIEKLVGPKDFWKEDI
jgi:hypothetical protein